MYVLVSWTVDMELWLGESKAVYLTGQPDYTDQGVIDMWRGVPVIFNGVPYTRSWGKHYAEDGYYYGQKWQCVEFMKRYYHDRMGHSFPDVMGNAADFFDRATGAGAFNVKRGLFQYVNGGEVSPKVDDIMVWTSRVYGHVAIVTRVENDFVEIVQQNISSGSRVRLPFSVKEGKYQVGGFGNLGEPAGWLSTKKEAQVFAPLPK